MELQLTPQTASMIQALMDTGEYHDHEEVIAEAVKLLEEERQLRTLRAAIADAEAEIERGEFDEWTPELRAKISREARQMIAEGRKPAPDVCP